MYTLYSFGRVPAAGIAVAIVLGLAPSGCVLLGKDLERERAATAAGDGGSGAAPAGAGGAGGSEDAGETCTELCEALSDEALALCGIECAEEDCGGLPPCGDVACCEQACSPETWTVTLQGDASLEGLVADTCGHIGVVGESKGPVSLHWKEKGDLLTLSSSDEAILLGRLAASGSFASSQVALATSVLPKAELSVRSIQPTARIDQTGFSIAGRTTGAFGNCLIDFDEALYVASVLPALQVDDCESLPASGGEVVAASLGGSQPILATTSALDQATSLHIFETSSLPKPPPIFAVEGPDAVWIEAIESHAPGFTAVAGVTRAPTVSLGASELSFEAKEDDTPQPFVAFETVDATVEFGASPNIAGRLLEVGIECTEPPCGLHTALMNERLYVAGRRVSSIQSAAPGDCVQPLESGESTFISELDLDAGTCIPRFVENASALEVLALAPSGDDLFVVGKCFGTHPFRSAPAVACAEQNQQALFVASLVDDALVSPTVLSLPIDTVIADAQIAPGPTPGYVVVSANLGGVETLSASGESAMVARIELSSP